MELNRKARAQSRNEVTLEGESDRGGSKGTTTDYDGGSVTTGYNARTTDSATTAAVAAGQSGRFRV